ncbi:zf-HC2 domain-containing protein [Streptomyces sp. ISL-98]|uniref:anti-sigma factor family protein n=1 Tax=Streptomyces sp. ISL-98 TaxID=2819192 RepID=UPI001BE61D35|nr:zf-HC2 domain-containing protein [Streptomyces sp. ISL-98]MBT2506216.1 zf-HC2 domain-containing protein [Streptomyces sp. ISL-98]
MSGTRPTSAEQHLGDRLAALVDGELDHDARERVLSHLATCAKCKAEADAQRRLKSVFSTTAPPPPSEGLLARLQGLPAGGPGGDDGDDGNPFGRGTFGNGVFGTDTPRGRPGGVFYMPTGAHALPAAASERGFRIHDVGRAEAERSGGRGRRFAFAAASAVSLAAFALGGAMPLGSGGETNARGGASGNNVTPLRTPTTAAAVTESTSRRSERGGLLAASGERSAAAPSSVNSTAAVPSRYVEVGMGAGPVQPLTHPFSAPLLSGAAPLPLIRPSVSTLPFSHAPHRKPPVSYAPSAGQLAAPSQSGLPVSP